MTRRADHHRQAPPDQQQQPERAERRPSPGTRGRCRPAPYQGCCEAGAEPQQRAPGPQGAEDDAAAPRSDQTAVTMTRAVPTSLVRGEERLVGGQQPQHERDDGEDQRGGRRVGERPSGRRRRRTSRRPRCGRRCRPCRAPRRGGPCCRRGARCVSDSRLRGRVEPRVVGERVARRREVEARHAGLLEHREIGVVRAAGGRSR